MKKVLFVVHTLQVGGAERVLINILKNIDKRKFSVTVLALVDDGVLVDEVKNIEGINYKYVFKAYFKKSRYNKRSKFHKIANRAMAHIWKKYLNKMKESSDKLYQKYVNEKYDVEIAFLEGKVAKFVANSDNKDSKKIVWIHTDINKYVNTIFKNEEEEISCYKKFDKIVCVSNDVKDKFIEKTGINDGVCVQINPIDSNDIIKKSNEVIVKNLNTEGLIVCTVGRLVKAKGYDRLLIAHKKLINEGIHHILWIVGDGIERKKLQDYIKANKLEKTVNLVGYTSNPYKYMKKADVFACTSRVEGLSTAIIEATILEKVIISTECPGCKDILCDNNENALIVENSTEGIYEGLKRIIIDEEYRAKCQINIKERSKLFNLETTIKQIETIIEGWGANDGYRYKLFIWEWGML